VRVLLSLNVSLHFGFVSDWIQLGIRWHQTSKLLVQVQSIDVVRGDEGSLSSIERLGLLNKHVIICLLHLGWCDDRHLYTLYWIHGPIRDRILLLNAKVLPNLDKVFLGDFLLMNRVIVLLQ
jgi:hypothetical protein